MRKTIRSLLCMLVIFSMMAVPFAIVAEASFAENSLFKAIFFSNIFKMKYAAEQSGEKVAGKDTEAPEIGTVVDGVLEITVAEQGDDVNGQGTEDSPLSSVSGALLRLRNIDKSNLKGITIKLGNGIYKLKEPIKITPEDSSMSCPLTIEGAGDALICGGVYFDSSEFVPADGEVADLLPEETRNKTVMLDLNKFGYSHEDIMDAKTSRNYLINAVMLSSNGTLQTLCRYPNEDWTFVEEGWMLDQYDQVTDKTDNDGDKEHKKKKYVIRYDIEHKNKVDSWSMYDRIFVAARLNQLWCTDNTYILNFHEDNLMELPYTGGYKPVQGGVFYWYNIPEELDVPGEYYVSDDAILYYYPHDDFDTSTFTLPVSHGLVDINADKVTLKNLRFNSSLENGITATGNDITVSGCEISSIQGEYALIINGNRASVTDNLIHDVCQTAVSATSGDITTLTKGDSLIHNNTIYNFGINDWPYTMGIDVDGVGITVSHNEIFDSKTRAIYWDGAYQIIEYNDVHDVLTASDDIGAISCDGRVHVGNVIRYNYIHNIGSIGILRDIKKLFPEHLYMGCAAIYGDFYGSYYDCYGNVIQSVNGSGFYGGGRGIGIHDNLIIDCSRWYVSLSNYDYSDYYAYGTGGNVGFPAYVYNDAWREGNPDLATLETDLSKVDRTDPKGYAMPVGIRVQNNWIHFNKNDRDFSNYGIAPYNISEDMFYFSGDTIDVEVRSNLNVSIFNSKREGVNIEELLEKAKNVIDLDYEIFLKIGLVK